MISGSFASDYLGDIHENEALKRVIIFCFDFKKHSGKKNTYSKVSGVYDHFSEAFNACKTALEEIKHD